MRIKTISRSAEAEIRDSKHELRQEHRNADPRLHPHERAREYTRAVKVAKLERLHAKPFVGALEGHSDGVYACAVNPRSLVSFVSAAADGEIIVWDLASQTKMWSVSGHAGFVRGVSVTADGGSFLSGGDDRTVKQWHLASSKAIAASDTLAAASTKRRRSEAGGLASGVTPVRVWTTRSACLSVDAHPREMQFLTATNAVEVWDMERSDAMHKLEWGVDSITCARWNPAEHGVIAACGNDRCVALYDTRLDSPLRKVMLTMSANAVAWNPREPFHFTAASEDSNLYTFDMRRLDAALMVHKDHVAAVMDVAYSPTGKEFVSGSYDRTVRIWRVDAGKSREMYHTKRMQRVFTVRFSGDAKYVLSGSDDTNVRIWKARAAERIGRALPRERAAIDYATTLKRRFGHMPEIRQILNSRKTPKPIRKQRELAHEQEQKERRKMANIRAHSKPDSGLGVPEPARKKPIVKQVL